MSTVTKRFPLVVAEFAANALLHALEPHCQRIEIAGSIRRKNESIGDIELVCIPRTVSAPGTLFTPDGTVRDPAFASAVKSLGTLTKGNPETGKYFSITVGKIERDFIKVDIFVATPKNWGLIFAIRTGPADYSHKVLAAGWVKNGYYSREGTVYNRSTNEAIPVPEEADLFKLAGVQLVTPQYRTYAE